MQYLLFFICSHLENFQGLYTWTFFSAQGGLIEQLQCIDSLVKDVNMEVLYKCDFIEKETKERRCLI